MNCVLLKAFAVLLCINRTKAPQHRKRITYLKNWSDSCDDDDDDDDNKNCTVEKKRPQPPVLRFRLMKVRKMLKDEANSTESHSLGYGSSSSACDSSSSASAIDGIRYSFLQHIHFY